MSRNVVMRNQAHKRSRGRATTSHFMRQRRAEEEDGRKRARCMRRTRLTSSWAVQQVRPAVVV